MRVLQKQIYCSYTSELILVVHAYTEKFYLRLLQIALSVLGIYWTRQKLVYNQTFFSCPMRFLSRQCINYMLFCMGVYYRWWEDHIWSMVSYIFIFLTRFYNNNYIFNILWTKMIDVYDLLLLKHIYGYKYKHNKIY